MIVTVFESLLVSVPDFELNFEMFNNLVGERKLTRSLKYFEKTNLITGYSESARKVPAKINFTQRVSRVNRKKYHVAIQELCFIH